LHIYTIIGYVIPKHEITLAIIIVIAGC